MEERISTVRKDDRLICGERIAIIPPPLVSDRALLLELCRGAKAVQDTEDARVTGRRLPAMK
jgi:hypothetical protein